MFWGNRTKKKIHHCTLPQASSRFQKYSVLYRRKSNPKNLIYYLHKKILCMNNHRQETWLLNFNKLLVVLSSFKWIDIFRSFENFTGGRKNHWGLILINFPTCFTFTSWFKAYIFRLGIQMPPKRISTALKAKKRLRCVKISHFWGKNVLSHRFFSKSIDITCCELQNISIHLERKMWEKTFFSHLHSTKYIDSFPHVYSTQCIDSFGENRNFFKSCKIYIFPAFFGSLNWSFCINFWTRRCSFQ